MYAVFVNNTDITEKVERRTLRITEQLNNRKNTATFSVLNDDFVQEHQNVEIYIYCEILSVS